MQHNLPNLVLLRQFVAVADHGSISEAARALNISQPAISKGIRKLEEVVGAPLVDRQANGVRLTRAGERFLEHAQNIALEYDHALQGIRNAVADQDSTINILAGPIWSTIVVPSILGRFHKLFPRIRLSIKPTRGDGVGDALRLGKAEIYAGAILDRDIREGLVTKRIARSYLEVIASQKHPLAGKARVTAEDIARYPFVVFSPSDVIFDSLVSFQKMYGACPPKVVLETASLQSCIEILHQQDFLFLETAMIRRSFMGSGLTALNIGEELLPFDIGLVHKPGLESPPHYARLIRIMEDAMLEFAKPMG